MALFESFGGYAQEEISPSDTFAKRNARAIVSILFEGGVPADKVVLKGERVYVVGVPLASIPKGVVEKVVNNDAGVRMVYTYGPSSTIDAELSPHWAQYAGTTPERIPVILFKMRSVNY